MNFFKTGQVYGESSKDTIDSTVSMVCLEFLGLAVAAFLATFFGVSEHSITKLRFSPKLLML